MVSKPELIVIFRMDRDGIPIALFPEVEADNRGNSLLYEHMGQHGAADYKSMIAHSRPAKPSEYRDLLREIKGIYGETDKLVVRKRYTRRRS